MRSFLTFFLAMALWAASSFIRVGSLETSQIKHTFKTIYVGSAYAWIPEALRDPVAALSSVPVLIVCGLLLILNLLHIALSFALAWMCIRLCLGQSHAVPPPLPPRVL